MSRNSPHFIELEGSLPRSQVRATCPYPESDGSSQFLSSHFLKIRLNIILPCTPGSSKFSLSVWFPTKTLYTPLLPIHATHPANFILLDLITRIIFGEQYRSLRSSLCSFLHSPVPPSSWAQIFFSAPYSQTLATYVSPSM